MSLSQRLRQSLGRPPAGKLLTGDMAELAPRGGTPAAVLVAVIDAPEPRLLLTVRREHLRTHAGQVAFPGGRIDPGEDAVTAALREAYEELRLDPAQVDVVGTLDHYRTVTDYLVTPVLGVIAPGLRLIPHQEEVSAWFEAPLAFLLDPANQQRRAVLFQGQERHYFEIEWGGYRIWGATAAMIVNLAQRLQWQ